MYVYNFNQTALLTPKQIKFVVNCVLLCVLMKSWCGIPEDGNNSGTCRR